MIRKQFRFVFILAVALLAVFMQSVFVTTALAVDPVTAVTGVGGNGKVVLNWTIPADATYYGVIIVYGTAMPDTAPSNATPYNTGDTLGNSTVNADYYGDTTSTSCQVTSLTNSTPYYFQIYAADNNFPPNYSTAAPLTALMVTPDVLNPVTSVIGTAGNGQVTLNWTKPTSATYDGVIIIYGTSALTGTTPSNGNVYSIGDTLGNGTVGFVGSGSTLQTGTVTGLTNDTPYYFQIYAKSVSPVLDYNGPAAPASTITPTAPPPVNASVSLNSAVATGANTALATGTATGDGITDRGFYYWNAAASSQRLSAGSGAGDFSLTLTGMQPLTQYNVRAYVVVNGQTGPPSVVSDLIISLTTLSGGTASGQTPKVVTFPNLTLSGSTVIILNGKITDVNGSTVTNYGFVYDNKPNVGELSPALPFAGVQVSTAKQFSATITKTLPLGTYYFRAYAKNSSGMGFGDEYSFTNFPSVRGDVNGDGKVDLADAIPALRIIAGIPVTDSVNPNADVNGDGKIGIQEVVYILQMVSGLR